MISDEEARQMAEREIARLTEDNKDLADRISDNLCLRDNWQDFLERLPPTK